MELLKILVGACLVFSILGLFLEVLHDELANDKWGLVAAIFLTAFCSTCLFFMIKFSE